MTDGIVKMDIDTPQQNIAADKRNQSQRGSNSNSRSKGRGGRGRQQQYRKRGKKSFDDENNNGGSTNGHKKKKPKPTRSSNICFQFAEKGSCDRGDKCKFLHELEENGPETTTTSQPIKNGGGVSSTDDDGEKESDTAGTTQKAHITDKRFADLSISAESRRALQSVFKYEFMTTVQAETLPLILKGDDCLAKAKTGTGKTLGFLIPTVETILQKKAAATDSSRDMCSLIISPTRELAFQIADEAKNLLTYHRKLNVVACVGGTNINKDIKALEKSVDMVVATPGRLLDHLEKNSASVTLRMERLSVLILDEADQLLDMGFRPDIERILKILKGSESSRQTLLFSATVPKSVSEIAKVALRPKYNFVDTVGQDEEQTHLHVQQQVMVAPSADHVSILADILAQETSKKQQYKIIVFFTTARLTGFMAELFNSVSDETGVKVLEIHSRKSQPVRKKASDAFRRGKNGVLFSSDVSARGMDYPDVTLVVQVGLTECAQYIHRLGRTARAGKQGRGILLLAPHEEKHMVQKELKDMPLERVAVPEPSVETTRIVSKALGMVNKDRTLQVAAQQAYRAWLGYYNSNLKKCKWDKEHLVVEANQWAKDIGLKQQPKLQKKTVGKMGLKGVPGLLLE